MMKKASHAFSGSEKLQAKSRHKPVGVNTAQRQPVVHLAQAAYLSHLSGHTTTRPQRQASLLHMQTHLGNTAVQRWLNGRQATPAIQRQCPCQEKDEGQEECPTCRQNKIQRQVSTIQREEGSGDTSYEYSWGRHDRLVELKSAIQTETDSSLQVRAQLELLSADLPEERVKLEETLNKSRLNLIAFLEERVGLLKEEIISLNGNIEEQLNSLDNDNDATLAEIAQLEQELKQHQEQLRPLKMWHMRQQIGDINQQLEAIAAELATLGNIKNSTDPTTQLLLERKAELEKQKEQLAKALTADTVEYEQFDKRWGGKRYGLKPECGSIGSSGCGPTTLAIVLNHLYREDPENLSAHNRLEIVTPEETATYAETNGRICGDGTSGNTMVTNVPTQWPGFEGERLSLQQATDEVRNGNLIIFLCRSCTGKSRKGNDKSYKGHFMVLSGVNGKGKEAVYDVLDPGANERADTSTISYENLQSHNGGFWIVRRK